MSQDDSRFAVLRNKAEELRKVGRSISLEDLSAQLDEDGGLSLKLLESQKRVLADIAPNLPRSLLEHVEIQSVLKKEELKAFRATQFMAELQPQLLHVLEELYEDQRRTQEEQRRLNFWALILSAIAATASAIQLIMSLWPLLSSMFTRQRTIKGSASSLKKYLASGYRINSNGANRPVIGIETIAHDLEP